MGREFYTISSYFCLICILPTFSFLSQNSFTQLFVCGDECKEIEIKGIRIEWGEKGMKRKRSGEEDGFTEKKGITNTGKEGEADVEKKGK